jgi:hypothetical protein
MSKMRDPNAESEPFCVDCEEFSPDPDHQLFQICYVGEAIIDRTSKVDDCEHFKPKER